MKIKIIRGLAQDMEKEIQKFINSLPTPSQIVDIKTGGEWIDNHIAIVIISYL